MSVENKEHLCVLCNNKLESKEALKDHFRKHANKEIDSKGRPVGSNGLLLHNNKRPMSRTYEKGSASKFIDGEIVCEICGEKFQCNTLAIRHRFSKHPNCNAKYYCPQCGMQFILQIHRDKHVAAHSPKSHRMKLKCNECGEVFYNRNALEYHFGSTHQRVIALYQPVLTPPPSTKIKVNVAGEHQSVYYCHLCGFEYIVKFNLQKHLERQHTKEERDNEPLNLIRCTMCEAMFYSVRAYENHNMYHKPDDLYVTSEQQRLATVSRVDQDFDIRRCVTGPEKYFPDFPKRRKQHTKMIPKTLVKQKEESSDEMSPPSSMGSSSESESETPLSKRLEVQQTGNREKKKVKTKTQRKTKVQKPEKEDFVDAQCKNEGTEKCRNEVRDAHPKIVLKRLKLELVKIDKVTTINAGGKNLVSKMKIKNSESCLESEMNIEQAKQIMTEKENKGEDVKTENLDDELKQEIKKENLKNENNIETKKEMPDSISEEPL